MNVELFNLNIFLPDLSVYLFIISLSGFNTFYKNRNQLIVLIYPKTSFSSSYQLFFSISLKQLNVSLSSLSEIFIL